MIFRFFTLATLLVGSLFAASGWQNAGSPHLSLSPDLLFQPKLKVTLRFLDREAPLAGPALAELQIQNISGQPSPLHLRLSADPFVNLELDAIDEDGEHLEKSEALKIFTLERALGKNRPTPSRVIELRDQETFSTKVDLSRFWNWEKAGLVTVSGIFRPGFQMAGASWAFQIPSESLRLEPTGGGLTKAVPLRDESASLAADPRAFQAQIAGADQVVERFFEFQESGRVSEMLELVDAASLLANSYSGTEYYQRYLGAMPSEKQLVLAEFRDFLRGQFKDRVEDRIISEAKVNGDRCRVLMQARIKQNRKRWAHRFDIQTGQFVYQWQDQAEADLILGGQFTVDLERQEGGWKISRLEVNLRKDTPARSQRGPSPKAMVLKDLRFNRGSSELLPESFPSLDALRDRLLSQIGSKIEIHGHTDNVGPREMNLELSRARAQSVVRYLTEHGIATSRVKAVGHGPDQPIAENLSESGRSLNRRVELELLVP